MSPLLDLFITFLSMGVTGYQEQLKKRKDVYLYFRKRLEELCKERDVSRDFNGLVDF
jgi:hypothetical protein